MNNSLQKLHDEMLEILHKQTKHIEIQSNQIDLLNQIIAKQEEMLAIKEETVVERSKQLHHARLVVHQAIFSISQN